jgi:protein-S-isoprenylcysteine O-methyltransferase Ste14
MEGSAKTAVVTLGAALFFVVAPGMLLGVIPYLLTGWQAGRHPAGALAARIVGALLIAAGLASVIESFARFVVKGRGTPAPVAPPDQLVVSGQYRVVRNPIYVALVAVVIGQALLLSRVILILYAMALWGFFHAWVLGIEEPDLRRRFGASYEAYCSRVWRWLPTRPSGSDA